MDNRNDSLATASELADSIFEALVARMAKGREVIDRDGNKRRMTALELKSRRPEFFNELRQVARDKAAFKMGQLVRVLAAKDERIAYLERLCKPQLDADRPTPINPIDPADVWPEEPTRPGLPAGIARPSQRPTPTR